MPAMGADNGLQLADLTGKDYDDADWDKLLERLSFEDMATDQCCGLADRRNQSVGKIATSDCDGPAGLNNFITKAYGTRSFSKFLWLTGTKNLQMKWRFYGQEYVDADNYRINGPAHQIPTVQHLQDVTSTIIRIQSVVWIHGSK